MKIVKPKILVVLGPTATGKSDLAVKLAEKFNGEVISADSRQVYKGMDIGSGKITRREMKQIPHHMLDIISPKKVFTVSDFKKLTEEKIKDILRRDKLPIICGGTGFYIQSIINDLNIPEVTANIPLRKKLEKWSIDRLNAELKKLDSNRASGIDNKNPVRLIRAIEIATAIGKIPKLR
ncbi:MAG: tRNA (adenosine(37)-N6)-dimethylallyltransferase MiaA, partial [Candidatus Vogelbacteria bacterium]|nr:tRNA (adenosine(37)-N6)-dimethylallyltransferase MiaA [Candidatus Vogelbacteria bacterium]